MAANLKGRKSSVCWFVTFLLPVFKNVSLYRYDPELRSSWEREDLADSRHSGQECSTWRWDVRRQTEMAGPALTTVNGHEFSITADWMLRFMLRNPRRCYIMKLRENHSASRGSSITCLWSSDYSECYARTCEKDHMFVAWATRFIAAPVWTGKTVRARKKVENFFVIPFKINEYWIYMSGIGGSIEYKNARSLPQYHCFTNEMEPCPPFISK